MPKTPPRWQEVSYPIDKEYHIQSTRSIMPKTPLRWQEVAAGPVVLSEKGAVATRGGAVVTRSGRFHSSGDPWRGGWSLTTTGALLTEGRHYWEVELLSSGRGRLSLSISCYFIRASLIFIRC
jgi:hypothetical protein